MKMFSDCSGECCVCASNICMAGHGDDDFRVASKEQIIRRLNKGSFPDYKAYMIKFLKQYYNYDYESDTDD